MNMIALASALFALAAADAAPERVASVAGGEHPKFSRIVIDAAGSPYRIDYDQRTVRIRFEDPSMLIDIDQFNDRRQAHRVIDASLEKTTSGPVLALNLTCKCGAKVSYGRRGKLIVDVAESYPRVAAGGAGATTPEEKDPAPKPSMAQGAPTVLTQTPKAITAIEEQSVTSEDSLEKAKEKMLSLCPGLRMKG